MLLDSFVLLMLSKCFFEKLWDFSVLSRLRWYANISHLMLMEHHTCADISLTEILQEGNASVLCLSLISGNGVLCHNCLWYSLLDVPLFSAFFFCFPEVPHQICVLLLLCLFFFSRMCWVRGFSHILKIYWNFIHVAESLTPPTE